MADVATVKQRVQGMLTELFGTVQIDRDGDFSIKHGSAVAFVRVFEAFDDNVVVSVFSPTNYRVPPSPELFHYVATYDSYVMGGLSATEREDGVNIMFRHRILGDTLDLDELKASVFSVAVAADNIDDEIKDRFGGDRLLDG